MLMEGHFLKIANSHPTPPKGTATRRFESLSYGNVAGFQSLRLETLYGSDLMAVRGVTGEPVSVSAEPGFAVVREIFRDCSRSDAAWRCQTAHLSASEAGLRRPYGCARGTSARLG